MSCSFCVLLCFCGICVCVALCFLCYSCVYCVSMRTFARARTYYAARHKGRLNCRQSRSNRPMAKALSRWAVQPTLIAHSRTRTLCFICLLANAFCHAPAALALASWPHCTRTLHAVAAQHRPARGRHLHSSKCKHIVAMCWRFLFELVVL